MIPKALSEPARLNEAMKQVSNITLFEPLYDEEIQKKIETLLSTNKDFEDFEVNLTTGSIEIRGKFYSITLKAASLGEIL